MKVTYLGTTVLLFDDGKDQLLFDAHLTRPSLMKYVLGSDVTNTEICDEMLKAHHMDRVSAIFVSHSHHDHVMDAPYIANKTGAVVYGSSSALNVCRGGNVPEEKLTEFAAGESYTVGNYKVTVLASIHSAPKGVNNDLGQTIDEPLVQPQKLRDYKEGGSYDFLVENGGRKYLIRPSFNYIEGQLDGITADVLFLGVAGIAGATEETKNKFFEETVEKVKPELVIPVHWDNFFKPLSEPLSPMPRFVEKTELVMFELMKYCEANDVACLVQLPRTFINC